MEVDARSFDQVVASLDRNHTSFCAASAGILDDVASLDEAESWGEDESSLSCFLAARYGVSSGTAHEWVRVSRALRGLPAIAGAHERGEISWDKLRPLTRFATPDTDERLASEAPRMRLSRLWLEARRHERARRLQETEEDKQMRYLRLDWDPERRFLHLEGDLPAEQGAALEAALEQRAQEVVLEPGPLYDRGGARLADALSELVTSGGERPVPATMVVHADADVLAGTPAREHLGLAETESGIQLSDDAIRRLACDARVEWVAEADGHPVGVGRQGRVVPGWMNRLLRHRDRECRFPGCDRRRWLHAHHLIHWADGGGTNLDNLVLLCGTHHRLIHEGGATTPVHPSPELRFHDPGARPLRIHPMEHRSGEALVPLRN